MTILVTGSSGQLGHDLVLELTERGHQVTGVSSKELNLLDSAAVRTYLLGLRPDAVMHCAGYTAVDKAEDDQERCDLINRAGTEAVARTCAEIGCKLLFISTDYVFSGDSSKPHEETDAPAPKSVYGASKLAGEREIVESGCRAIIIRTSWLFSEYGNNFVKTMLRLGTERESLNVVNDQIGGPTYAGDLARVLFRLIEVAPKEHKTEFFHFANEGVCSWYDFAKAIMEIGGKTCRVNPICTSDYPAKARRPAFSVFNLRKTKMTTKMDIPYWKDSLRLIISKL